MDSKIAGLSEALGIEVVRDGGGKPGWVWQCMASGDWSDRSYAKPELARKAADEHVSATVRSNMSISEAVWNASDLAWKIERSKELWFYGMEDEDEDAQPEAASAEPALSPA